MLVPFAAGKNYEDLSTSELFELVLAIKQLQKIVSEGVDRRGSSVVIQEFDNKAAVSTMKHLRVHIFPHLVEGLLSSADVDRKLKNFAAS